MVKVLKIKPDVATCHWVLSDDRRFAEKGNLRFDGSNRLENWHPPQFYSQDPTKPKSNFHIISAGAFAFDQSVMDNDIMVMFFEMAGEILPIQLETGEPLYILNITEVVNALDIDKAVYRKNPRTGAKVKLTKHAFKPDRFTRSSIFKIPETQTGEILTFSGLFKEPLDEFYTSYQKCGFKGLRFEEVWSEEANLA